MDGEEVVKEVKLDLEKGLNPLNIADLPKGQFTVKLYKDGLELSDVVLGVKDSIRSASVIRGELLFELASGLLVDPSKIIHVGG